MTTATAMRCGATTRAQGECGRPAGWGTDHVGAGRCKLHGGCTPDGRQHGAKALLRAEGIKLGMGLDVPPDELMITCVRQAAGALQWATQRLEQEQDEGGEPSAGAVLQYGLALDRATSVAKTALAAGIAERRLRIAQRMGALIASAVEGAITDILAAEMGIDVSPQLRAKLAARVETNLLVLEQGDGDDGAGG